MASSKEYVDFILEQCEALTARAMMGEYVLYYGGKVVGGVYDNRLLVKPTSSAKEKMPNAPMELPYEGAKEMLLVENMEDKAFLQGLFAFVRCIYHIPCNNCLLPVVMRHWQLFYELYLIILENELCYF